MFTVLKNAHSKAVNAEAVENCKSVCGTHTRARSLNTQIWKNVNTLIFQQYQKRNTLIQTNKTVNLVR